MSDYAEYVVNCTFSAALDQRLLDTLHYLVRAHEYACDAPSDHPFFEAEEFEEGQHSDHPFFEAEEFEEGQHYEPWRDILQVDPDEERGYFAQFFRVHSPHVQWLTASGAPYILSFRIAVHEDEEGNGWRLLEWLATISDSQGFVGYSIRRGYGASEHPTLWYFENQQLVFRKVDEGPSQHL